MTPATQTPLPAAPVAYPQYRPATHPETSNPGITRPPFHRESRPTNRSPSPAATEAVAAKLPFARDAFVNPAAQHHGRGSISLKLQGYADESKQC
jgi:hypothetical protein